MEIIRLRSPLARQIKAKSTAAVQIREASHTQQRKVTGSLLHRVAVGKSTIYAKETQ